MLEGLRFVDVQFEPALEGFVVETLERSHWAASAAGRFVMTGKEHRALILSRWKDILGTGGGSHWALCDENAWCVGWVLSHKLVAHQEDESGRPVLGVHWAYVRDQFRKMGLATRLVAQAKEGAGLARDAEVCLTMDNREAFDHGIRFARGWLRRAPFAQPVEK